MKAKNIKEEVIKVYIKDYVKKYAQPNIFSKKDSYSVENVTAMAKESVKEFIPYLDLTLQTQRAEFLRIVKEEFDTHVRYGKSTIETKMRFKDIIRRIKELESK